MKREIKFRAWDVKKMKMSKPFTFDDVVSDESYGMAITPFIDIIDGIKVDRVHDERFYCLMQYTGLKDKNGKEIYEGDIVNFHYFFLGGGEEGVWESEHQATGVITWGLYGWAVSSIRGEHWQGYTGYDAGEGESNILELMMMNESSIHEESFEVIGNIHENPELL